MQHKNDSVLFAPSQGTKNVARLCCSCFQACDHISGNLFTQTWEMVTGQSNSFISYKSKQINLVKHSKFVINMTGDFP